MKYYVLEIYRDVEPFLHGAYTTEARRDKRAKELRQKDPQGANGLFWLTVTVGGDATTGFYSNAELDDNP
jgi:hypothetical protein